jgi:hypothetical protein
MDGSHHLVFDVRNAFAAILEASWTLDRGISMAQNSLDHMSAILHDLERIFSAYLAKIP